MATKHLVLSKAINTAINNGWTFLEGREWAIHNNGQLEGRYLLCVDSFENEGSRVHISMADIIFSHDFANALWGEPTDETNGWTYHLQQLVIADDQIEYLESNI